MLLAFVIAFIVSYIISIPPGPISMVVIRQAAAGNVRGGLTVLTGSSMMDTFYTLPVIYIATPLVRSAIEYVGNHPVGVTVAQIVVVLVLVLLGAYHLFWEKPLEVDSDKPATPPGDTKQTLQERAAEGQPLRGPTAFGAGVAVALTNIPNPTFFPSLFVVISTIQSTGIVPDTHPANIAFALGFGAGTAAWLVCVLAFVVRHRKVMPQQILTGIHRFAGGTFVLFGLFLATKLIFWGGEINLERFSDPKVAPCAPEMSDIETGAVMAPNDSAPESSD